VVLFGRISYLESLMQNNQNHNSDDAAVPGKRKLARRLKKHVKKQLEKIEQAHKESVEKSDSNAVHDLRVATRRLATVLNVVTFSNPDKAASKARKRLKKLRHALSAQRDIDVLLKKMRERSHAAASRRRRELWNMAIQRTRDEGKSIRSESAGWLKDFDLRGLERRITSIARRHLKNGFDWSDLGGAAHRAVENWRQIVQQARSAGDSSHFHEIRIKTKTLRYLIELAPRLSGNGEGDELIERFKNIQDELGEWRDQAELCRRLTLALSADATLQADPVATSMIDTARSRARHNDQQARRIIASLRGEWDRGQIASIMELDESQPRSAPS
jgi:CHAD domain-containing protein